MLTLGITGASGFLGTHLRRFAEATGRYRVRALTRSLLLAAAVSPDEAVEWVQGDLALPGDCADFVRDLDVILHLAHTNTPLTSDRHLPSDVQANMLPTLTLLEAIRAHGRRPHVVFASSGGSVYGSPAGQTPLHEDSLCAPASSYGIQKLMVEHYLRLAAQRGWLTATCLRIANPYGILLPPERRQGFIGVAVQRVLRGEPIRVFGNSANVRDYVHLDDVARAFDAVARPRSPFAVYNIGSGTGHSIEDLLRLIERVVNRPVAVEYERDTQGAAQLVSWNVLDIHRAARDLQWIPSIPLEAGLRELLRRPTA